MPRPIARRLPSRDHANAKRRSVPIACNRVDPPRSRLRLDRSRSGRPGIEAAGIVTGRGAAGAQVESAYVQTAPRLAGRRGLPGAGLDDCRAGPGTVRLAHRAEGTQVSTHWTGSRWTRLARRRRARRSDDLLRGDRLGRRLEIHRRRRHVEVRSSTTSRSRRSARLRSRLQTRTSSTSAPAKPTSAATSPPATASTSRPTPARRGRTCGSRKDRSARWSSTRRTRTSRSPRCSDTRSGRMPSAASTARRDGGKTVAAGAEEGRGHRRVRRRDGSLEPVGPVRRASGRHGASPWDLTSGGPGSGLYVSRDGGDTWKQLTGDGLPDGIWGKVGVAVAPSDGRRVYALIEAEKGGLFRSDDGGDTWELVNRVTRAAPARLVLLDPDGQPARTRRRVVPAGADAAHRSMAARRSSTSRASPHGDHHDVWIDPTIPKRMIAANDGGVDICANGGETWYAPPLPIAQFYHVSADNRTPYHVAGAMQDLGTAQGPSISRTGQHPARRLARRRRRRGRPRRLRRERPDIVYAGEYLGIITRYDHRTGESRNVSAWPENPSGHGGEDMNYRFQWTAPIAASPHDPEGDLSRRAGRLPHHATAARPGTSSARTSPATTSRSRSGPADRSPATTPASRPTGTVFAIAESPQQAGVIWAGSDDGLVHVTRDGGQELDATSPRRCPACRSGARSA